jgi:hypothetical protein
MSNTDDLDPLDIGSIVKSVQADISHLKNQLQNLPPFPQGKYLFNQGD